MSKAVPAKTIRFDIFIAGDGAEARRICRAYCMEVGLCVHVADWDFIYTGGAERGVRVGLINYPRFRTTENELSITAHNLVAKKRTEAPERSRKAKRGEKLRRRGEAGRLEFDCAPVIERVLA